MTTELHHVQNLRIAVEGCGHGKLHAIYESVKKACEARQWDGVDLLIIGGDFQAIRNANDLVVMSCPIKYRAIGDFHSYYSGTSIAPYLTIFVGGNHEASSHMWELYYGGWAAPNIYYLGAANVVRVGGVRIAGMSGIWRGSNYNKAHYERLPYNHEDIKSVYSIRELDVRKLLQIRTQVDVGISHDWPRAVEWSGDHRGLFHVKPFFERESKEGTLGSTAAAYVMDRLRPPYWFSAHMHVKFAAAKIYEDTDKGEEAEVEVASPPPKAVNGNGVRNEDEIDLDLDDEDSPPPDGKKEEVSVPRIKGTNSENSSIEGSLKKPDQSAISVPEDIRAQLPAAFSRPRPAEGKTPGQPVPPGITNRVVRFLALDKCLPGRKFLQLLEVKSHAVGEVVADEAPERQKAKFEYDPEWLAITRVFAAYLVLGDRDARPAPNLGEEHYKGLIEKELDWVQKNVVEAGKLEIPENFVLTAPPFEVGTPEIVHDGPVEYSNPQTQQYCDLVGIPNPFDATEEERLARMKQGPARPESQNYRKGRGRGGGGEGGYGGRGGGPRQQHGGRGGGGSSGRGRGRGRGW